VAASVEPNSFVAEVYRRMSLRHRHEFPKPSFDQIVNDPRVLLAISEYETVLPSEKSASILDIGFGGGWFLAACLKAGYSNLEGADFGIENKSHVREWAPDKVTLHDIQSDIGDFLKTRAERYDFIHMSHVIEHIPKYSLLWVVDALYLALRKGGMLLLRTPNMEGPAANSSFYVTLAHEYGFAGSNLKSLLDICGFDDITFRDLPAGRTTTKQKLGSLARFPFLVRSRVANRLFGANVGGKFGGELIVTAKRGDSAPLFDERCR
jgi:2-polyprenyl-3-methyl-5-hydroxy-6-metoxy-1,4-benzoquinol methylase